jgi:SMC interacting uncharacterized protein involved in chromosome segregation
MAQNQNNQINIQEVIDTLSEEIRQKSVEIAVLKSENNELRRQIHNVPVADEQETDHKKTS